MYYKVVAVKKLVAGFLLRMTGPGSGFASGSALCGSWDRVRFTWAWNNKIDLSSILLVSTAEVMIDRDGWVHSYLNVRAGILGFVEDGLLRKHLPRMFLIKDESLGIEDDQIPES